MNIYEKILAIMQDVQYLAKDDHVKFGSTDYKALSEEKVTSVMRDELIKFNLVVFPIAQDSNRSGNITHVDTKYRMVNVEKPDEFIEIVSCGDGADSQDKGSGKAMTYAFKYMWLRVFALPTGEDPDKISSAELDEKAKKEAEKKAKEEAKKPSGFKHRPLVCSKCGAPIAAMKLKSGKELAAQDVADIYGVCLDCLKKEKEAAKTK